MAVTLEKKRGVSYLHLRKSMRSKHQRILVIKPLEVSGQGEEARKKRG